MLLYILCFYIEQHAITYTMLFYTRQLLILMSFLGRVLAVSHESPSAVFLLDKHLKNVVALCVGQVQSP